MAAPFWRIPEGLSDIWFFCSAVDEGVRFLDPKAIFNAGSAPAEGFKPL
jgi:hypothetical protein